MSPRRSFSWGSRALLAALSPAPGWREKERARENERSDGGCSRGRSTMSAHPRERAPFIRLALPCLPAAQAVDTLVLDTRTFQRLAFSSLAQWHICRQLVCVGRARKSRLCLSLSFSLPRPEPEISESRVLKQGQSETYLYPLKTRVAKKYVETKRGSCSYLCSIPRRCDGGLRRSKVDESPGKKEK